MQSIENKILYRINGKGRGWTFTKIDFVDIADATNVHQALSSLSKTGQIRRVLQGLYDYPCHSERLNRDLSPNINSVALAFARKFNWRVQASGDAALNLLGLSNQVPARWTYLSDGPNRKYSIDGQLLTFKHVASKDIGFKCHESGLLVQALKALGKRRVDDRVIEKLRRQIKPALRKRILTDTRTVTAWIYGDIKKICEEDECRQLQD